MENRRAYYRLILLNFAAAFYNLAVQWMTGILLLQDLGPRRALVGVLLPALAALVFSAVMLQRHPRGIPLSILGSGFAIQLGIWVLIGLSRAYEPPLRWMWIQLILALVYACLTWKIMMESYRATVKNARA